MQRKIIKIDEEKCTGCGLCIPSCPEGALQIIDGKARLVSDLMCDGLGACIGDCPEGAIEIEEREAQPYDEIAVIREIVKQGENTLSAHLSHLAEHGEDEYLQQAINYLKAHKKNLEIEVDGILHKYDKKKKALHTHIGGCPGAAMLDFTTETAGQTSAKAPKQASALRQWPVQMHLVNPMAPYFRGKEVILAADCVAFAMGNFHADYLQGNSLAIACPKLDQGKEVYVQKLQQMIDEAEINSLHVMIMEVPCCGGLVQLAKMAQEAASRKIPLKQTVVSIQGEILRQEGI